MSTQNDKSLATALHAAYYELIYFAYYIFENIIVNSYQCKFPHDVF